MKFLGTPHEGKAALWSGVALVTFIALEKLFWVLLPTGVLNAYSSADGWQRPDVSSNLSIFRDMSSVLLKVPTWYLGYGYFYGVLSAMAWLAIAVLLAMRKPFALWALFLLCVVSIIHGVAISLMVRGDGGFFPWKWIVYYGILAAIFTRPAVRAFYVRRHA